MCGIVGVAGDLYYKEEATIQALLLLDYFRGKDSTGFAAVRNSGEVKIAKLASDPITLFQMGKFKDALNGNNSKLFLGHNRASTSGSTNNYNAHPYQFGHITGVQNGTLEMRDKPMLEEMAGEKFEVDSQALFAAIAKCGVKDVISELHESYDGVKGAWALVWYDSKEDTINFLRNPHRPLWLGWDEGFKRLFFASQWQTMSHACEFLTSPAYKFEKFERHDRPGEFYRFFNLAENQHIKFNLKDMVKGSDTRPKPVCKMIKGKEPEKGASATTVWNPFPAGGSSQKAGFHTPTSPSSTTTFHSGSNRSGERVIHLFGTTKDPYANVIGFKRFDELIQMGKEGIQVGCSFCRKDIEYGAPGITVYEKEDVICCAECSGFQPRDEMPAAKIYVTPKEFRIIHDEMKKAA